MTHWFSILIFCVQFHVSAPILVTYVLLFTSHLICSSFSLFLKCKIRLLILEPSFLTYAFNAITFILNTAFTVSTNFSKLCLPFCLVQNILFLLCLMYYLEICCIKSKLLEIPRYFYLGIEIVPRKTCSLVSRKTNVYVVQ